jgi:phosphoglycerol transferase MdoB-like AlkP superfamily enzyme
MKMPDKEGDKPLSRLEITKSGFVYLIIIFANWLLALGSTRLYSFSLAEPEGYTSLHALLCGGWSDTITFALIILLPSLFLLIFLGKWGWIPMRIYTGLILLAVFTLSMFNAIYMAWSETTLTVENLYEVGEIPELWLSGGDLIKSAPALVAVVVFLSLIFLRTISLRRNQLNTKKAIYIGLLAAAWVSMSVFSKTGYESDHAEELRENILLAMYKKAQDAKRDDERGKGVVFTKDNIRKILVEDIGDFEYLSDEFPLIKNNQSFSKRHKLDIELGQSKPNIVIFFVEGLSSKVLELNGGDSRVTPNLNKLAKNSLFWKNYYANSVQTWRSSIAALSSMYAPDYKHKEELAMKNPLKGMFGLGEMLKTLGYETEYYHNGPLSYANKDIFFRNLGYDEIYGIEDIEDMRGGKRLKRFGWGIGDEHLMEAIADRLNSRNEKDPPVHLIAFTVSTHHPFNLPYPEKGRLHKIEGLKTEQEKIHRKYENVVNYTDKSFGVLMKKLSEKTKEETIFIITGDTSTPLGMRGGSATWLAKAHDELYKVPLIIYAPSIIKTGQVINEVASHVDMTPTILDMVGYSGVNHTIGKSLLGVDKYENNFAYISNTWNWFGLIQGDLKYIEDRFKGDSSLYDLGKDPQELVDIKEKHPLIVKKMKERLNLLRRATNYMWEEDSTIYLWPTEEANISKEELERITAGSEKRPYGPKSLEDIERRIESDEARSQKGLKIDAEGRDGRLPESTKRFLRERNKKDAE